ncbi:hypothetical protein Aros01_06095 [Streptosporangium roseum]|uniref:Lipoprotein n=1 Tax=Streptosporangium roseum (strain ATCC 12428 / DSM 43021 / JCM 3005 / KCTC 9067 / NCIMB 10171 / NRRL 2505 / NI 9100) TaxID=479432 RepID=D2BA27_STRRD|nr:hypothetical protein Sros_3092 [Streptosporangium roseum DSM 43021]
MRRYAILALTLAAATALSACGGTGGIAAENTGQKQGQAHDVEQIGKLDVSVLRVVHSDFSAYESPEALAADRPIVAAGVIDGWQQGPILESYPNGPLDYRAVLRVRVTEPLKGVKGRESISDGLIYIELDQGGVVSDPSVPAGQWKPRKSIEDFDKALPAGTKILVFPRERPRHEMPVRSPGAPLPPEAKLMVVPPQGLVLEDPQLLQRQSGDATALVGGQERLSVGGEAWFKPKNMGELVTHLKQRGFSE